MSDRPSRKLSIILERQAVESRWESHRWLLAGVAPDEGGSARTVAEDERLLRRLHPGVEVTLFPDEAEGYYLNVSSEAPSVDGATGEPFPFQATLSYNEAARWMDASEKVERAPAWPELAAWMRVWVEANYRPPEKQRRKPRSFQGKEGRLREKDAG